jgi:DNA-binding MarR family transcriptional regulator
MKTLKEIKLEISQGAKAYYIYLLYKPDGTPFYVGKGKKRRIDAHESEARRFINGKSWKGINKFKLKTIKKIWDDGGEVFYAIDSWHDELISAGDREENLVNTIGKRIYGEGTLTNILDGGVSWSIKNKQAHSKKSKKHYENSPPKSFVMEKEELEELLSRLTRAEIIQECNISQSTLSRLIKKYGLTKKGYGSGKLNIDIARKIRTMHALGDCTQTQLALAFNVSQPTIHKVLNNTIYKSNGPRVTGEASVKVGYNY